jgi:haloacetate dehalogenase
MWHTTAPALAEDFKVITADIRGYGDSMTPPSDDTHYPYSKRQMAIDMVEMMKALGHERFFVAGHDRGARVTHRMARDHRGKIAAAAVLDICPTLDMYEYTNMDFAAAYFHWFFLIQPYPLPESMILSDPHKWMNFCLQKWSGGNEFGEVEQAYLKAFSSPDKVHASCEDYRAAATIDLEHDREDRDRPVDIPLHVLWGERGVVGRIWNPIEVWQKYTTGMVTGKAMATGHFVPEEDPEDTIAELRQFFSRQKI